MDLRGITIAFSATCLVRYLRRYTGNKWSIIATKIPDKDDGNIKNKFYSTLRKGLRKINKFIVNVKKKSDPTKFKAMKTI